LAFGLVLASSADTRLIGGSTTSRAATRARSPVVGCRIEHLSVPRGREPFVRIRVSELATTRLEPENSCPSVSESASGTASSINRSSRLVDQERVAAKVSETFVKSPSKPHWAEIRQLLAGSLVGREPKAMLFSEPSGWWFKRLPF